MVGFRLDQVCYRMRTGALPPDRPRYACQFHGFGFCGLASLPTRRASTTPQHAAHAAVLRNNLRLPTYSCQRAAPATPRLAGLPTSPHCYLTLYAGAACTPQRDFLAYSPYHYYRGSVLRLPLSPDPTAHHAGCAPTRIARFCFCRYSCTYLIHAVIHRLLPARTSPTFAAFVAPWRMYLVSPLYTGSPPHLFATPRAPRTAFFLVVCLAPHAPLLTPTHLPRAATDVNRLQFLTYRLRYAAAAVRFARFWIGTPPCALTIQPTTSVTGFHLASYFAPVQFARSTCRFSTRRGLSTRFYKNYPATYRTTSFAVALLPRHHHCRLDAWMVYTGNCCCGLP